MGALLVETFLQNVIKICVRREVFLNEGLSYLVAKALKAVPPARQTLVHRLGPLSLDIHNSVEAFVVSNIFLDVDWAGSI